MIGKRWDTLTTRFILVMSAALIISNVATTVLLQGGFERLIAWNVRFSQSNEAVRVVRGRTVDDVTVRIDDAPLASRGVRDPALSDRLTRASGYPVEASWTPVLAEFQNPPIEADGAVFRALHVLLVSRRLDDGRWSNFAVGPRVKFWPPPPSPIFIFLGVSLLTVIFAAALVGARVARPFRDLARGAERLSSGNRHEALILWGPSDVRRAQSAFNTMAARIDATMTSQRELLAAIGHDLRTPITALRLRAELLKDGDQRQRFIRSLDELQHLTEAALAAGAGHVDPEPHVEIDLGALVEAVCADCVDQGSAVHCDAPHREALVDGWPASLIRAVRNLVENALRYAGAADVHVARRGDAWAVIVEDRGPGIPAAELERVKEPLVRLETSRSKDTGGHGLGLSITASIAAAHGGALRLSNRSGGGLSACLILPAKS